MAKKKTEEQTVFLYKGIPLTRHGNVIIYGDVNDKYYLRMSVLKTKTEIGRAHV